MKVKIFQASGFDEIEALEHQINEWITNHHQSIEILHSNTAMCQLTERPDTGERYQHMVITVWYDEDRR